VYWVLRAAQAQLVNLDSRVTLDRKETRDSKDNKVIEVRQGELDSQVVRDQLGKPVTKAQLVVKDGLVELDQLACLAAQVKSVLVDSKDLQEILEMQEYLVLLDLLDNPGLQEIKGLWDLLEFKERQEPLVLLDLKDNKGRSAALVVPDKLALLDLLAQSEHQEALGLQDNKAIQVHKARPGILDFRVKLVSKVSKV